MLMALTITMQPPGELIVDRRGTSRQYVLKREIFDNLPTEIPGTNQVLLARSA
jgi:hypothetical protein